VVALALARATEYVPDGCRNAFNSTGRLLLVTRKARLAGTDIFTAAKRSQVMSLVRSRNTRPELLVRSALRRLGCRFSVYKPGLPGRPDIVFEKQRIVVFVHGCFWHQHPGCRKATIPKQHSTFWRAKLTRNVRRDGRIHRALRYRGWRVLVVWECQLRRSNVLPPAFVSRLRDRLRGFPARRRKRALRR